MRRLALIALAVPVLLTAPLQAQEPAAAPATPMAGHAHAMSSPGASSASCGADGASCPCMAMMASMDSSDAQIASLTAAMNKASGNKKTEAMAAVVNALVQDRVRMQGMMKMMHEHMEKMMGGMGEMGGMDHMKTPDPTPTPKE